ncbi:hypothetical protein C0993_002279 [Termitomyces sp. T159_Od127]|nr:hypothetical protein C0993_002279 [Termitomyces sp. T159_Od127]
MFQAKPLTFQLESSRVAFATLYLQSIAFDHYMALLQFNPNSPVLSNWQAFAQEFSNVLRLTPKQPSYDEYKALVTQIDQQYWEDRSEYSAPHAPWNPSGNSNWQNGAAAGNQTTGTAPPPIPATWLPLEQGPAHEALDPNQADPDSPTDPHNTPDYADDKEALCASRFRNWPWINILEETQEKRQREGACILCGEQGHFINECPKHQVVE